MVVVSARPLRAAVPGFGLFAPREAFLPGSLGEPASRGEPRYGEPDGEAFLGLAAGDFLLSRPRLKIENRRKIVFFKDQVSSRSFIILKPDHLSSKVDVCRLKYYFNTMFLNCFLKQTNSKIAFEKGKLQHLHSGLTK